MQESLLFSTSKDSSQIRLFKIWDEYNGFFCVEITNVFTKDHYDFDTMKEAKDFIKELIDGQES